MIDLTSLIAHAQERRASDIHLTVGMPPVLRVDGTLVNVGDEPLTEEHVYSFACMLASQKQLDELRQAGESDFAVTFSDTRMRCSLFKQQEHTTLALRLLPLTIPSAQELGLPKVIIDQAEKPRGLVLVTGPTGSGKSSTLAALLDHINNTKRRHIITLEHPIEFVHQRKECIINQREVGRDTESFASGLRAALRQDPDVILVGEMRDLETISTAITAAETGHLVFSTLHTVGAANTIDRIVDSFPSTQQTQIRVQLAEGLKTVVSQQLLPDVNGGLVPAYEIMHMTSAIRSLIRDNKGHQIDNAIAAGAREGMISMDQSILALYRAGHITKETALEYADNPEQLRRSIG